jgi:hypothetical protein
MDDDESTKDSIGEAMETVLGFGKHRGKTMCELVRTKDGRSYLTWVTSDDCNIREETKAKCRIVLDFAREAMKTKK